MKQTKRLDVTALLILDTMECDLSTERLSKDIRDALARELSKIPGVHVSDFEFEYEEL